MCTAWACAGHRAEACLKTIKLLILLYILVFALSSDNSGMVPAKKELQPCLAQLHMHTAEKSRKGYNS
jgi:hypothetical protein